jgi:hypothetical protein
LRQIAAVASETNRPADERERFTIRIDLSAGGKKDNVIVRTFDIPLTLAHDENEPLKLLKTIEPTRDEETNDEYERI